MFLIQILAFMQLSVLIADTNETRIDELVHLLSAKNTKMMVNITSLPSEVASLLSASAVDIVFLNVDTCHEDLLHLEYDTVPVVVTGEVSVDVPSLRILPLDEYRYRYPAVKDFLPMPFQARRLEMVLEAQRNYLAQRELEHWKDEQLLAAIAKIEGITSSSTTDNAAVPDDASILYCEANRNYTTVYRLSSEGQLVKETLSRSIGALDKEWSPTSADGSVDGKEHPFLVRIHHSTIVNSRFVAEVRRHENRKDYIVRLVNGTECTLSRNYKHVVQRLAPTIANKKR
jgi:DNA-binding LytR/AlgR family response regulator